MLIIRVCGFLYHKNCHSLYLDKKLDVIVRETTDGDRETLDNLLMRVSKEYKEERIDWMTFLINFTKRGKLRPNE